MPRNLFNKVALKPLSALNLAASNAALYTCRENTGTEIADLFDAYADGTLGGTTAAPLTASPGWASLNGTDSYYTLPGTLVPDFSAGSAWVFACRLFRATDASAGETLFSFGDTSATSGECGVEIQGTGGANLRTRGKGSSTPTTGAFATFDMTTYNAAVNGCDIAFVLRDASWPNATFDLYIEGAFVASLTRDFSANSGTKFTALSATYNLRIGARAASTITSTLLGNGSSAKIANILVHSQAVYDATAVANIIAEHHKFPGEKLRSLA